MSPEEKAFQAIRSIRRDERAEVWKRIQEHPKFKTGMSDHDIATAIFPEE